jgi:galactokinase
VLAELAQEFRTRYGRPAERAARAPGRVNLIGEHTDYNEGLVLPCAVDRDTVALVARRGDTRIRVFSRERDEECHFELTDLRRRGDWVDYVQGVFFALREEQGEVPGFDIAIASEVPLESGLSSSAALGLALVTALDLGGDLGLSPEARARIAHRGESGFVGVGCGVMDQLASGLGRRGCALRIDCRTGEVEPVPLPTSRLRMLIIHSGRRRALGAGEQGYGERREECRRALAALSARAPRGDREPPSRGDLRRPRRG